MSYFDALSYAEQTETEQLEAFLEDGSLSERQKDILFRRIWSDMELDHGSDIRTLVSPDGTVLVRPKRK